MKRSIIFSASLATAVALFALGAQAQQGPGRGQGATADAGQIQARDQARIMTIAQIASRFETQGYTLREIELERGVYEVEMLDGNGLRVTAYLNAATGEVLPDLDGDREDGRDAD